MESIYFIYSCLICIATEQSESLTVLPTLKREVRFTTFDVQFLNKSTATMLENTFKQFNNKHALFLRFNIHDKVNQFHVKTNVLKCKDHFVDCVNVVTYEMCNVCEKLGILMHFLKNSPSAIKKCPVVGEFAYTNMTIDADKFGSTFGSPGEKWWEYYWKTNALFYTGENVLYASWKLDYYFIEFRSRNR